MRLIPSSFIDRRPFNTIQEFLASAQQEITLFAPYMKKDALCQLLPISSPSVVIVTSWKMHDLWLGASDIMLYPYLLEKSHKLYINNAIHLKVYMADWMRCICGSSNISLRGLGLTEQYNRELNVAIDLIDNKARLYLRQILTDSILVNDAIYKNYVDRLESLTPPPAKPEDLDLASINRDQQFLISALPMSRSIDELFTLYKNNYDSSEQEAVNCAMHDIALYKIPPALNRDAFLSLLKSQFFSSQFIIKLLEFIDAGERYFGEMKAWIQNNCADVPVPSRRDLTGNIQILYRWIVDLSDGQYAMDRPNYSERINRVH